MLKTVVADYCVMRRMHRPTTSPEFDLTHVIHAKRPIVNAEWANPFLEKVWELAGSVLDFTKLAKPEVTIFGSGELLRMQKLYAPTIGSLSMDLLADKVYSHIPASFGQSTTYIPSRLDYRQYKNPSGTQNILVMKAQKSKQFCNERQAVTRTIDQSIARALRWDDVCPIIKLLPITDGRTPPEGLLDELNSHLPDEICADAGYIECYGIEHIS